MSKDNIFTISMIKTGSLKGFSIFDPNWTNEDIEFLRQLDKPITKFSSEEEYDPFHLSEKDEAKLIVSALRDKMELHLKKGWQGTFGIQDCRNEIEVLEVLEGIEKDLDASEGHSAEASFAYMEVKPICNVINKYKLLLD